MRPTPPEKLRLGGMALANGLLVHGPTHWAAAIRATPRTSGVSVSDSGSRGFRPEATSTPPSSRRTATAQWDGPWTRMPFWSAMPPRRSFSGSCMRAAYPLRAGAP